MAVPGQVAADASAALDAGRWAAILGKRREEVRDCPWALDRDFLTAMAVTERLFLLERPADARERNPALKPRVALRKVAHHLVPQALSALRGEWVQPAALLQALKAQRQAWTGESESGQAQQGQRLQAQSPQVQKALRPEVQPQLAQRPAP